MKVIMDSEDPYDLLSIKLPKDENIEFDFYRYN